MAQCIFISYPTDYKGWRFWNRQTCREVIMDSAVFCKSIFPFRTPGLSGEDRSVDPLLKPPSTPPSSLPAVSYTELPIPNESSVEETPTPAPALAPAPAPTPAPALTPAPNPPWLVVHLDAPVPIQPNPTLMNDLPEQPQTPPKVRNLTSHFEQHPSANPLPAKHPSQA